MPSFTFEFGLPFASVLLIGWSSHRFSGPPKTLPFLSSYFLRAFSTSNYVPLSFGVSLLKGQSWQPPTAISFQSSGSKRARLKLRVCHGTGNLHGTRFCARVSSNLPRIENPQ